MKECLDIFITDEDLPIIESVRNFVNREIIPIREDIEKDKSHELVQNILQGLTKLGLIRAGFPEKYSNMEEIQRRV